MIQTWAAELSPLKNPDYLEKCYCQLGRDTVLGRQRQEKADRQRTAEGKMQSIGAGLLLLRMKRHLGLGEDFLYNLSHSGNYALCSVEDGYGLRPAQHLGCDIETVKDYREAVAGRFFTENEYRYITSFREEEKRTEAFYRYWVLKESFMKAVREGMKLNMKSFEIQIRDNGPVLVKQPEAFSGSYWYQEYPAGKMRAKTAVCADTENFADHIHMEAL